jgi:putative membrane protein
MPISQSDPRVFFAAERTLLAWLRTGLTIMGLGFVVARFGLFLQLLSAQTHDTPAPLHHYASSALGIAFVLAGTLSIAVSALQHRRFVATLASVDLPPAYSRMFALALSLSVAGLGAALAVYLIFAPH